MSQQVLVRRYAEVLYEETDAAVHEDMQFIRGTLEGSRDFRLCLASPAVAHEKKLAVLEAILTGRVQDVTLRFVRLLTLRRREVLLLPIARAYEHIRDERLGITNVQARVRFAPSDREMLRIQRTLEEKLNARVRLRVEEDTSLIGGMVLRIGDIVYDGSVAHQLERLRGQIDRPEV